MPKQPAVTLLIKPASGSCNLRCRYCFYADEMNNRSERTYGMMSEETLDILVEKTLNQVTRMATFAFQGGEPTLAGLDFFRTLIEIEKKHNHRGVEIHNSLQTNGIVMTTGFLWAYRWTATNSCTMKTANFLIKPEALRGSWKQPAFSRNTRWNLIFSRW